jgi:hypothetical protein
VTVSDDLTSRLAQGRRLTDQEIGALAASHDIITIGMRADDVRHRIHGGRTTFLRVVDVAADSAGITSWPSAAGEVRIVGTPLSRKAAVDRVRHVSALAKGTPVSGFSLAELEQLAAIEGVTLRALLEELQAAGLDLVADAAFDQLQDPKRSIEEVNISGLALARLTIHQLPSSDMPALFRRVADLQRRVAVIRAFAPLPRAFNPAVPTTGYDDVKRVALARLIVDNIASIQVDWSLGRSWRRSRSRLARTTSMRCPRKTRRARDGVGPRSRRSVATSVRPARSRSSGTDASKPLTIRPELGSGPPEADPTCRDSREGDREGMTRVRLGSVSYLNARPCVVGLDRDPRFDLRFDVPSRCAELLQKARSTSG